MVIYRWGTGLDPGFEMGVGVGGGGGGGVGRGCYTPSQKGGSGGHLYRISVERGRVHPCTPPLDPALGDYSQGVS